MSQIHHDVTFAAAPSRVYRALTDAKEFAEWTGAAAAIDATAGGALLCFGEFILGRNVELVQDQRIVQAWRVFNWPAGVYSIVRFELTAERGGTRLEFDQDGVPADAEPHVNGGWETKYWAPLREYFKS